MKLGIWVECEHEDSPFVSEERLNLFVERVSTLEISGLKVEAIYLQVLRRGTAYFQSSHCEQAPIISNSYDPLRRICERLSEQGIAVHAWINCCNFGCTPSARALEQLGADSLIHDHFGTSIASYEHWSTPRNPSLSHFSVDTPGAWIDPSSPTLAPFLQHSVSELLEGYPLLSGIHLDFIRYPYMLPIRPGAAIPFGLDLGLGPALRRFSETLSTPMEAESHFNAPGIWRDDALALRFDQWRRTQVTSLVQSIRATVGTRLSLSAAVLTWSDRAYLSAFQDWRSWLQDELLDAALLMSYSADLQHVRHMIASALPFQGKHSRVHAGIGCYKLSGAPEIRTQLESVAELGAEGAVLFSYCSTQKALFA